MLLAAQSMAIGTVMVRWVSKYSDPVMATGWVCHTKMNVNVECHQNAVCLGNNMLFLNDL